MGHDWVPKQIQALFSRRSWIPDSKNHHTRYPLTSVHWGTHTHMHMFVLAFELRMYTRARPPSGLYVFVWTYLLYLAQQCIKDMTTSMVLSWSLFTIAQVFQVCGLDDASCAIVEAAPPPEIRPQAPSEPPADAPADADADPPEPPPPSNWEQVELRLSPESFRERAKKSYEVPAAKW